MSFGFKNTPAQYKRSTNQILSDLVDICVLVYLDDILIRLHTEEENQKHLYIVLNELGKFKYYIKHKKKELFSKRLSFFAILSQLLVLVLIRPR